VIRGIKYQGSEVDAWSAGVILFAMITGKLPYDEGSYASLFKKIREADYIVPEYVSESLKDLFA